MNKLKIFIVEKGIAETVSPEPPHIKLKDVLKRLEQVRNIPSDSYSALGKNGDVINIDRSVESLITEQKEVFIFSRKQHFQPLELPPIQEEWPIPAEESLEVLQHISSPMTAPSKLVFRNYQILQFEKDFFQNFQQAKKIYSEFYSKFHFIQEVIVMLDMKAKGETVSKSSLEQFFMKKQDQFSKFQKMFNYELNKKKKLLNQYDKHFQELGEQPIDEKLVPLLAPKFQQFPRPTLLKFLPVQALLKQKSEWLMILEKFEQEFSELREEFDTFDFKLRNELNQQRVSIPKSAMDAEESCKAMLQNGESLEEIMKYMYMRYKEFRQNLQNVLKSAQPDVGLESLKENVQEGRDVIAAFRSKLPFLEKNIKAIRYISDQITKEAEIQHEGLNETLRSLSLLGKNMKTNCFKPQKDLQARAEAHFQNFVKLEIPWCFRSAYKHTITELKRRSHFHQFLKLIFQKLQNFLQKEQEKRNIFQKDIGSYLPTNFIPSLFSAPPSISIWLKYRAPLMIRIQQLFEDAFQDIMKLFNHSRIQDAEKDSEIAKKLYQEEANKSALLEQANRDLRSKLDSRDKDGKHSQELSRLVQQLQQETERKTAQLQQIYHNINDLTKLFKKELPQKIPTEFSFKEEFKFLKHRFLELNRDLVKAKDAGRMLLKQSGLHDGEQMIRFMEIQIGDIILFYSEPDTGFFRAFIKGRKIAYYLDPSKYPDKNTKLLVGRVIYLNRQVAGEEESWETVIPLKQNTNYFLVNIERQ